MRTVVASAQAGRGREAGRVAGDGAFDGEARMVVEEMSTSEVGRTPAGESGSGRER